MAHPEYFTFVVSDDPKVGTIENLDEKFEDYWMLTEGMPLGTSYPPKLELMLSKNGGLGSDKVEFLPFTLKDKKRKKVPEPYYIANALECIDCFDWDRSVYKTYPDKKKVVYSSLRKLHVLEDKLPETATFFRLGELKDKILIRSDLVEKLKAAGCTGMSLVPMGGHIL